MILFHIEFIVKIANALYAQWACTSEYLTEVQLHCFLYYDETDSPFFAFVAHI